MAPVPGREGGDPRRCLCPGSYDPITLGHLDVLERAAAIFDEVIAAVLYNPAKQGTFSPQERVDLVQESTAHLSNVSAEAFGPGLVVDVCRDVGAGVMLKGLRGSVDFEYELPMAVMNREMTGVETLMLPGDPALSHYSSSLVRQIASLGGDVSGMVPPPVAEPLRQRLSG